MPYFAGVIANPPADFRTYVARTCRLWRRFFKRDCARCWEQPRF